MAEVEQLLSWVRYERSRLAGYEQLDEILTIVTEAKERVVAAEKQVKDYETKCEGLAAAQSQRDAEFDAKTANLQVQLDQRKAEADANFDKALTERKETLAKYEASIAGQVAVSQEMERDIARLLAQRDDTLKVKTDLESDVTALRKQLQDIKDSIH